MADIANRQIFTYSKGNIHVTVEQLEPGVNEYQITTELKYTYGSSKLIKPRTCMFLDPITGEQSFLVSDGTPGEAIIPINKFNQDLY